MLKKLHWWGCVVSPLKLWKQLSANCNVRRIPSLAFGWYHLTGQQDTYDRCTYRYILTHLHTTKHIYKKNMCTRTAIEFPLRNVDLGSNEICTSFIIAETQSMSWPLTPDASQAARRSRKVEWRRGRKNRRGEIAADERLTPNAY